MRIGLDARMIRVTGIGRYLEQLIGALFEAGYHVVPLIKTADVAWWKQTHPQIKFVQAPEPIYSWREQLTLPARIRAEKFDIMHFGNFNVPLTWGRKAVVTLHDVTPLRFAGERKNSFAAQRAYKTVLSNALGKNKHVIVPSAAVAKQVSKIFKPASLTVIPHALSKEFFAPTSSPEVRAEFTRKYDITKPYVLYVGNMRAHKNIEILLRSFAACADDVNGQLVLAGPADSTHVPYLQKLAHALGIEERLRWTGELMDKELIVAYDSARLLVHPSLAEGFGFTLLEAAARKLPVVTANSVPTRALLGRGVLSFNPHSVSELTSLLTIAWSDEHLRSQLITRARTVVAVRKWKDVARETADVYRMAIHKVASAT